MALRSYEYITYSPCGNDTALVLGDDFSADERKAVNDEIMAERANVEQVGFLSLGERKLTMAGGEFCGNAVRCAAFYYLGGEAGEIEIEICGEKVKAGIDISGVWVEIPKARCTLVADGVYFCRMNGINHIVVTEDNKDALGVIFYKGGKINPIVYVPQVGTCFNETACISGTAAAFSVLGGGEEGNMPIEQPSGKFFNVSRKGGGIIITGEVVRLD